MEPGGSIGIRCKFASLIWVPAQLSPLSIDAGTEFLRISLFFKVEIEIAHSFEH